jgi:shikimate 5-dehydrogenase
LKKWTSISPTNEEHRWANLSAKLKELGVANEYVKWEGDPNKVEDVATLEPFDHVRLSTSIGPQVLKRLKVQSSWATLIGVIDGMVKTQHGWWPLCALYESFGQLLIKVGQELDPRGSVLVAGAGGIARVAIAAFFKAGFSNILLTNFKVDEAEALMNEIRGKMFGLNVQWVPMEKIVLLSGESSALVNCTPSIEENALLIELSYLNFLKRPGFLFDSSRYPKSSILVQEALDSGVNVIDGIEIAARADVLWAKWAFGVDLPLDEYRSVFQGTLKDSKPE